MANLPLAPTVDREKPARSFLADIVSLTKPRITTLVLVTTAGGLVLAPVAVPLTTWVLTLLGMRTISTL